MVCSPNTTTPLSRVVLDHWKIVYERTRLFGRSSTDAEWVLHDFGNVSGTRNVGYVTRQDLALIFEGRISLINALLTKIDAPEKQGRYLIDLAVTPSVKYVPSPRARPRANGC